MELHLVSNWSKRVHTTSHGSTGLVYSSSTKTHKVVVGDHRGTLTCFASKKGKVPQVLFASTPTPEKGKSAISKVSRVSVDKERVFVAANSEVRGYTKKGVCFYFITTFMSEPIHSMYVYQGRELHVAGDSIYSHYIDNKECPYYMSDDMINDMLGIVMPAKAGGKADPETRPTPVLACGDRAIRVVEGNTMVYQVTVDDVPKALCPYTVGDGSLIYGTEGGKVGMMMLGQNGNIDRWLHENADGLGGVTCLSVYDMTGDGILEILVGRECGTVEVMRLAPGDDYPETIFSQKFASSITSVLGGRVTNPKVDELIVTTFSGQIFGMTANVNLNPTLDRMDAVMAREAERAALEEQVTEMQKVLAVRKSKYEKDKAKSITSVKHGIIPEVDIRDTFKLNEDEAAYVLTLELPVSIDMVMLQCDIPVDMLSMRDDPAVRSFTQARPEDSNMLLVTYTYPPGTTRVQLKIRSIEGQYGTLQAYIVPKVEPKLCTVRKYKLCALSLHQRISRKIDVSRPLNKVTLTGDFSFADMHSWVSICLPNVPNRVAEGEKALMTFVSTFLGTQLECGFEAGVGTFRSDNMSTISILKDVIVGEATAKSISVKILPETDFESVRTTLQKLLPRLEAQQQLTQQVDLIEPLKELAAQEGGTDFMCLEHLEILQTADDLLFEYKEQPSQLERLVGMITDLFIDANRFKGIDVGKKTRKLTDFIEVHRELEEVMEFVMNPPK